MSFVQNRHKDRLWEKGTGFRLLLTMFACLVIAIGIVGCSSNKSSSSSQADKSDAAESTVAVAQDAKVSKSKAEAANSAPANAALSITPAIGSDSDEGFNRKLIYQANLVMPVKDYAEAQTLLRNLVAQSGAYILQFSENSNTGERGGNFTIKVAANGFSSLLDGLEQISPSLKRSVTGQDVTEEYVDLDSRLKAKQAVEVRLLGFMEKAAKTDELLAYSNELAKVQEELEKLKGRIRYLDQHVSYSTVELRMYQKLDSKAWNEDGKPALGTRLANALDKSLKVLSMVLQGLLVFLAAALPIVIVGLIIFIPVLMFRRKRKQKLADMRNQLRENNSSGTAASPTASENMASKDEQ